MSEVPLDKASDYEKARSYKGAKADVLELMQQAPEGSDAVGLATRTCYHRFTKLVAVVRGAIGCVSQDLLR